MSAPFVSAAAAMVYSASSDLTPVEVRSVILNTAKKNDSLKGKIATGGMLDCGAAVAYVVTGSADGGKDTGADQTQTDTSQPDASQTTQTETTQPSSGIVTENPNTTTNIGFGLGSLNGWYGWHFRMDIPQLFRIVLKMSGSVD